MEPLTFTRRNFLVSSFPSRTQLVTNLVTDPSRPTTENYWDELLIDTSSFDAMNTEEVSEIAGKRMGNGNEIQSGTLHFIFMNIVGSWTNPFTQNKRVAVAILCPILSSKNIDYLFYYINRGWVRNFEISWLTACTNTARLLKICLDDEIMKRIELIACF